MHRKENAMKELLRALLIGLLLPACVLIGLTVGWIIGRKMGGIMEFVIALSGGLGGLILGSFLVIKLILREGVKG